jgi:hypothetical protein
MKYKFNKVLSILLLFISTAFGAENTIEQDARVSRLALIESSYGFTSNFLKIKDFVGKNNSLNYLYDDIDFIYEKNSTFCPGVQSEFIKYYSNNIIICNRIIYKNSEYQSFSILIKKVNNPKELTIINVGHTGLPEKNDEFYLLTDKILDTGGAILVTSMPFLGLERADYPLNIQTHDGWGVYNPALWISSVARHGVFELFYSGNSNYMRYFIDNAVLSSYYYRSNFKKINYVGLSGGATTGLIACAVLKNLINNCILTAGVMPLSLRMEPDTIGDAEQFSSSFYKQNTVYDLIKVLESSRTNLFLVYNSSDPCCFDSKTAIPFKKKLENLNLLKGKFIILDKKTHSIDVDLVYGIISSNK